MSDPNASNASNSHPAMSEVAALCAADDQELYRFWASDNQVYGPVPLEVIKEWVRDGRVEPDQWLFLERRRDWRQARRVDGLDGLFAPGEETTFLLRQASQTGGVTPEELLQVPALSGMSQTGLVRIIKYGELVVAQPGELVLRRHEPGDSMLFVLSGSLRARIIVGREEKTLSVMTPGQVLGEIALFTQNARTADVVAEEPSRLFRLSAQAVRRIIDEIPEVAAPMLYAIGGTMARRILDDNARFQKEVASAFVWR